jgi:hypothetical protein
LSNFARENLSFFYCASRIGGCFLILHAGRSTSAVMADVKTDVLFLFGARYFVIM